MNERDERLLVYAIGLHALAKRTGSDTIILRGDEIDENAVFAVFWRRTEDGGIELKFRDNEVTLH